MKIHLDSSEVQEIVRACFRQGGFSSITEESARSLFESIAPMVFKRVKEMAMAECTAEASGYDKIKGERGAYIRLALHEASERISKLEL